MHKINMVYDHFKKIQDQLEHNSAVVIQYYAKKFLVRRREERALEQKQKEKEKEKQQKAKQTNKRAPATGTASQKSATNRSVTQKSNLKSNKQGATADDSSRQRNKDSVSEVSMGVSARESRGGQNATPSNKKDQNGPTTSVFMTGVKPDPTAEAALRKSQTSLKNQSIIKSALHASIESKASDRSQTIRVKDGDPAANIDKEPQTPALHATQEVSATREGLSPLDVRTSENEVIETKTQNAQNSPGMNDTQDQVILEQEKEEGSDDEKIMNEDKTPLTTFVDSHAKLTV